MAKLRSTVAGADETIRTGTEFEKALTSTVLDENGNEVPAYSEDQPLDFGLGVQGYTSSDGKSEFMKATPENGHPVTVDVTHLSPNGKAIMGGYLGLWKAAADAGEIDYFLDVVQFDFRGQSVVDEIKLIEAAQTLNAVFGGRTGYNGEIVRGSDQIGLIQWQAQLKSPKGDAGRSDNNKTDTKANLQGLRVNPRLFGRRSLHKRLKWRAGRSGSVGLKPVTPQPAPRRRIVKHLNPCGDFCLTPVLGGGAHGRCLIS